MIKKLYETKVSFTVYVATDGDPNAKLHELVTKLGKVDTAALNIHWDEVEWEAFEGFESGGQVDDQTMRIENAVQEYRENPQDYTMADFENIFEDRDPTEFL